MHCDNKQNVQQFKHKQMTKEELTKEIERKEQEIADLVRLQKFVGKKNLEIQIDIRLKDLSRLYELRDEL